MSDFRECPQWILKVTHIDSRVAPLLYGILSCVILNSIVTISFLYFWLVSDYEEMLDSRCDPHGSRGVSHGFKSFPPLLV